MSEQKSLVERLSSALTSIQEYTPLKDNRSAKEKIKGKFNWEKKKLQNNLNIAKNKTVKAAGDIKKFAVKHPGKAAAIAGGSLALAGAGAYGAKKLQQRKAKHESLRESFDALKNHSLFEHEGNEAPKEDASITGGVADNHAEDQEKHESLSSSMKAKFNVIQEKKEKKSSFLGTTVKAGLGGAALGGIANSMKVNRAANAVHNPRIKNAKARLDKAMHEPIKGGVQGTIKQAKKAWDAKSGLNRAKAAKKAVTKGSFLKGLKPGAKIAAGGAAAGYLAKKGYDALKNRKVK